MEHNGFLKIIRDEFSEEISLGKISQSKYINSRGKEYDNFILTFNQSRQLLTRESKFVRKAVIDYIERLENELKNALERERLQVRAMGKALRNLETSTIQRLLEYGNIPKKKWKLYFMKIIVVLSLA